ncbi:MAG: serine hydrolase [Candidatus Poribacteria bacterium]|nr:serine hydrolase [Candidatus Poribacteria bacterium]
MVQTEPNPTLPDWITYPEADWISITPAEAGLDLEKWADFLAEREVRGAAWEGEDHTGDNWGTILTRGGYRVQTWGNGDYKFQTASVGKAFNWAVLGLAVERGLVNADDRIHQTWTGEGQLSHPHKYLDRGHHKKLTWRCLGQRVDGKHWGGFPVTNGYFWRRGSTGSSKETADRPIPEWANWTGDPFYDNYAHAEPGTVGIYSSGGQWRLVQALTALWNKDIKQVLDDELFGEIGIPAEAWDWTPGRVVHEDKTWYAHMPGYGDFLDAPYEINGHQVRGGGGWVVMSAKNLARYGHFVATGGVWKGKQLLNPEWVISHGGGNGSLLSGESTYYTAMGKVTTWGIEHPLPDALFVGPVQIAPMMS